MEQAHRFLAVTQKLHAQPKNCIGVLDSGDGGLQFTRQLEQVPGVHSIYYWADTASFPYGTKSAAVVLDRVLIGLEFLANQGVGSIVVACNTAGAAIAPLLQEQSIAQSRVVTPQQVVLKVFADLDKSVRVGVIATALTVASNSYKSLFARVGVPEVFVIQLAQQPLIYAIQHKDTQYIDAELERITELLASHQVTHVILGCTHYSYLASRFMQQMGDRITICDPTQLLVGAVSEFINETRSDISQKCEVTIHWTGEALIP